MSAKLSFCVKAASLPDPDSNALTDSIEHYLRAGVTTVQAESMAVDDLIAAIQAERKELVGLLRAQHPDAFERTEQTPAQKSAAAKARLAFNPETDSVLQAIAKMGGMRREVAASEFGLKPEELKHSVATGGLKGYPFRATGGLGLDNVLTNLQEAGYFPGVADEDARGTLEAAIFDELGGGTHLSVQGQMRNAQDRSDAKLDADEAIEREALLADAALTDDIGALSDDDVDFFGTSNASTEDAMRALGFSDEDIRDEAAREAAPPGARQDGQAAAEEAAAAGRARGQEPGPAAADAGGAGFELAGQSAGDLTAKAARAAAGTAAEKAAQTAIDRKAAADAARGEFTLTGSDRPADVAAAGGQQDLLAEPPTAAQRAKDDLPGYLREQIPKVLADFQGKLSIDRLLGNLGDPNKTGHMIDPAAANAVIDELVAAGTLVRKFKSILLPTPDNSTAPRVTNAEGREYREGDGVSVHYDEKSDDYPRGFERTGRITKIEGDKVTFKPNGAKAIVIGVDRLRANLSETLERGSALDLQTGDQLATPDVIEGDAAPDDVAAVARVQAEMRALTDKFQSLKITALPRLSPPRKGASEAERLRYAAADLAEKLYGQRVVWFHANVPFANGMQADYLPGVVLMNEATTRPVMALLGHELTHTMRATHPALYAALNKRLDALLTDEGKTSDLNLKRAARGMTPLPAEKLREERNADIVGDFFTDPVFWRQVAQGQPNLFARVLRVIRDFLDDVLAKLRKERPYGTERYLTDVTAAREAVVDAMREFANSPKTAAAAVTAAANHSENNDPFYSELGRQIQTAKMGQGSAQAWKDYLKGLTSKGVKADEIAWTGIEDWLDLQPGKVTREQVLDYLNNNGVRVTETALGGADGRDAYLRSLREMDDGALREEAEARDLDPDDFAGPDELIDAIMASFEEDMPSANDRAPTDAKYSNYQLPGGTNYTELLLTMPGMPGKQALARKTVFDKYQPQIDGVRQREDAAMRAGESDPMVLRQFVIEHEQLVTKRDREAAAVAGEKADYRTDHWEGVPNILAHVRFNERTDAEGQRVLFIEEIQSDWAQEGKRKGFQGRTIPQNTEWQQVDDTGNRYTTQQAAEDAARMEQVPWHADIDTRFVARQFGDEWGVVEQSRSRNDTAPARSGVPAGPFVGKTEAWVGLAIKRMVKYAVDNGFDRVAFVNGKQSAERYSLEKQVRRISWTGDDENDRIVTIQPNAGNDIEFRVLPDGKITGISKLGRGAGEFQDKSLDDVVGKDMAAKIMAERHGDLSGDGLKIGGKGMEAFYDKIVPNVAKDVIKKLGGQITSVPVPLEVKDYGRTSEYVGPLATFKQVQDLFELSQRGGADIKANPITGRTEEYAINRVAVEGDLRILRNRMDQGLPFDQAIVYGDISQATAALFGGRIMRRDVAPDVNQHVGFDITPAMREKAAGGLPMFSLQYTADEEEALRKAGINTRTRLQRAGDRIRAHYGSVQSAVRSNFARQFQQGALDQFTGLNLAVRREIGALPVDQDPYVAARLANGATSSVMRGLLLHGQAKWAANGQHLEKIDGTEGLLDILRPLDKSLNDFFGWMIGNRAARLMKEGRENNFTPAQIAALQGLNRGKENEFRRAALGYAAFKRSVLDVAEQAGLLDPEARKVWDNADYIPFYREIDDKAVFGATGKNSTGPRPMKGLAGQSSGIRTLKGGEAGLNDPMENILMNFSRLIDASLKNRALTKTIDVLEKAGSDIVHKVGYDMNRQVVPASEVKKQLQAAGTPDQILDIIPPEAFEGMAKMWAIQAPTDPDVVRVMRGGKPAFYKVSDPLLLKSLTSFIPFDFPGLGVARAFKRVLTATVTATPEFMARNFIRDTAATAIITRDGFHPGKSLTGIVKSYRESGAFEDLLFAGASFQSGNINGSDPVATGKAMRRALRKKGFDASSANAFMASVVDTPAKFWEAYKHVGESIENANREAVYEATIKAGKGATAAAYESKDLMDFSLRGSSPVYQVLADVLPFFNARVQGLYRLGRTDPARLVVYGLLMTAASLALAFLNSKNDDYDKLPDWDKESYWHFWICGEHFRVPKPFELGAVFASVPERVLRYAMGQDTGKKTLERMWAIVRDQLAFDPVPQLIRPALNTWANTDTFRDRPIENMGDETKLPSERYSKITSATAVAAVQAIAPVADKIGLSPKKLEYLVGGYLGTAGLYALGLSDMAVRKFNNEPPRPATRLDELPLIRSFYRQEPAVATVYETDLYKMRTEIDQVYKSVSDNRKSGRDERADQLETANEKLLEARQTVHMGAKALAALNKQRDEIYEDRDLTPKQKREALDALLRERAEIARDTMKSPEVISAQ